jgi:uncharacterized protein
MPHNVTGARFMIIDFHTHIFSGDVCGARENFLSDGQFRCVYENEKARLVDHRSLMAAMSESGIDYAVAMGFPWEREEFCAAQNEYLASVIKASGGTIIPFGSVPAHDFINVEAWVKEISNLGLRGIGEISFYRYGMTSRNIARIRALLGAARMYSLPLCIHVNEPVGHRYPGKYDPNLRELYAAVIEYPDVAVVFSHWGGGLIFYELMPEVSKSLSHCYYDTAASPFLYAETLYGVAPRIAGSKKILFGTDYPLLPPSRYLEPIGRIIEDEGWKADILGMNAARLLKIG